MYESVLKVLESLYVTARGQKKERKNINKF